MKKMFIQTFLADIHLETHHYCIIFSLNTQYLSFLFLFVLTFFSENMHAISLRSLFTSLLVSKFKPQYIILNF